MSHESYSKASDRQSWTKVLRRFQFSFSVNLILLIIFVLIVPIGKQVPPVPSSITIEPRKFPVHLNIYQGSSTCNMGKWEEKRKRKDQNTGRV